MNNVIKRFTVLANAARTAAAEDIQSNKLLSLSQVVEKWMIETCREMKKQNYGLYQDLISKQQKL